MQVAEYYPVLIQFLIAVVIAAAIIGVSHLFGQRGSKGGIKDTAYECGMLPQGPVHARFSIKFYMIAMLFILFDIEVVFLIPFALVYREFLAANLPILMPILFFIGVLVIGLIYEVKKGALEWEK